MVDTVREMWDAFLQSGTPQAASAQKASYTSWHFGSGGAMADELAALVLAGEKRATTGDVWSYEIENEPLPQVGDFSVITDGSGTAVCVIRTTRVDVVPFDEVSEEFAATEGEGDKSLEYWREVHWRAFGRYLAEHGLEPTLDMPLVCERFEVVYPQSDA